MFKTLLKINVQSLFLSMFSNGKGKEKKSKKKSPVMAVLIALLAIYVVACLIGSVALMFSPLAEAFGVLPGLEWLYFALAGILIFLLTFVGSIFSTQNLIFKAKDNELLLSMPVPTHYILGSRIASLFVLDIFYAAIMGIPIIGVYFYHHEFSLPVLIFYIIGLMLIIILSAALTAFCGWAIAIISTKFKNTNFIQVVLSVGFLVAYMGFAMNMREYLEKLIINGETIAAAVKKAVPPFYWFGKACTESEFASIALLAVTAIIPFILGCLLISKSFVKIATTKKSANKKKYVAKELTASSAKTALFKKEVAMFISKPMYMLNSAIGGLMLIMFAVMMLVKGDSLGLDQIFIIAPGSEQLIPLIIAVVFAFCSAMCNPAASSISLEGSRINVLRSMPVSAEDFFFAKYALNFIIGFVPLTVSVFFVAAAFEFELLTAVALYISAVCFLAMSSFVNLTANLIFPKFSWQNEMVVIKQSAAVLVAMLSGMALTATLYVPAYWLTDYISFETYLFIQSAVCVAICLGFIKFYKSSGKARFERMYA